MFVVVAPDSFKGTATAAQAAAAIAQGVRAAAPEATVAVLPMADGGEGTAHVLADAAAARGEEVITVTLPVTDATGRLAEASYFLNASTATAYIDIAAASGIVQVQDRLDPLHTDTYGTGVLIADAESKAAASIVLGLGGTASIDGGSGILAALGAAAHDSRGYALPKGGAPLVSLDTFDTAQLNMKAALLDFTLLADTATPPLLAAQVFGPQKGADAQNIALLTGAMLRLCEVTDTDAQQPYFGAAGCVPVALAWLSRALWGDDSHVRVLPGAKVAAEELQLSAKIAQADLVISGEGVCDATSFSGKVVGTVAQLCADHGTNFGLITGTATHEAKESLESTCPGAMVQELSDSNDAESTTVFAQIAAASESLMRQFLSQH